MVCCPIHAAVNSNRFNNIEKFPLEEHIMSEALELIVLTKAERMLAEAEWPHHSRQPGLDCLWQSIEGRC
jgi:hypothetical protein